MIMIAACIGVMSGLAIIVFREAVELVKELIMGWGYETLGIERGGWRRLLLPLLPMFGAAMLIPLSLAFPGKVNGYGFTAFLFLLQPALPSGARKDGNWGRLSPRYDLRRVWATCQAASDCPDRWCPGVAGGAALPRLRQTDEGL